MKANPLVGHQGGVVRGGKLPRITERQEQAAIVKLLRSLGGQVYVIGTTRRAGDFQGTMQTPGIPDLLAFLPPSPRDRAEWPLHVLLFVECKAVGGRLSVAQCQFQESCDDSNVCHLVGGVDDVLAWLTAQGYLR